MLNEARKTFHLGGFYYKLPNGPEPQSMALNGFNSGVGGDKCGLQQMDMSGVNASTPIGAISWLVLWSFIIFRLL